MSEPMFEDVYRSVRDAEDHLFDLSGTIENVQTSLEEVRDELDKAVDAINNTPRMDLGDNDRVRYAHMLRTLAGLLLPE